MKKRILQLCVVAALGVGTTVSGQISVVDFESASGAFPFNADKVSVAEVANPSVDATNPTANVLEYTAITAQTTGEFEGWGTNQNISIDTNANGDTFELLFRSDVNNIPVQFQIQYAMGSAAHNSYSAEAMYTGNGAWQVLSFTPTNSGCDFSSGSCVDAGPNTTGMYGQLVMLIAPGTAGAAGEVFYIDQISHGTLTLSNDSFNVVGEAASIFVKQSSKTLEITKSLGSDIRIVDMAGRNVMTIDANNSKSIDLSSLRSGFYMAMNDSSSFKFAL